MKKRFKLTTKCGMIYRSSSFDGVLNKYRKDEHFTEVRQCDLYEHWDFVVNREGLNVHYKIVK